MVKEASASSEISEKCVESFSNDSSPQEKADMTLGCDRMKKNGTLGCDEENSETLG